MGIAGPKGAIPDYSREKLLVNSACCNSCLDFFIGFH
jgi:hypothetical protein